LTKNFFSKINIPQKNINFINGESPNLPSYIEKLRSFGGADIVMLGVGLDGHLAFNEPPLHSSFTSRIGEVRLNQSTIKNNQPDYPKIAQNPFAYTMGMADIFESKYIYFLAKGSSKSSIIFQSLQGEITPDIPASMLQLHPNVTAVLDFDAALLLK
jgi:glucosamine-6-phosphate deaminase